MGWLFHCSPSPNLPRDTAIDAVSQVIPALSKPSDTTNLPKAREMMGRYKEELSKHEIDQTQVNQGTSEPKDGEDNVLNKHKSAPYT